MSMLNDNTKRAWVSGAFIALAALVLIVIFTGRRAAESGQYTRSTIVMGTSATFTVYGAGGADVVSGLMSEIDDLDRNVLSWRSDTSEVHGINTGYQPGCDYEISDGLAVALGQALDISEKGDGLLDVTIRPLSDVWGIEDGRSQVPDEADIKAALLLVDETKVSLHKDDNGTNYVNIAEGGMSLDLGAVGKGYGCDAAADYLDTTNVDAACVALGGSILCYGEKPDGSEWRVGINNPDGEGDIIAYLVIDVEEGSRMCVSTSGDYEKYFEQDGRRYCHILNPHTGYPTDTGTSSVTVVCENGLMSDGLATVFMLMDRDEALALANELGVECLIIDSDGEMYGTDDMMNVLLHE